MLSLTKYGHHTAQDDVDIFGEIEFPTAIVIQKLGPSDQQSNKNSKYFSPEMLCDAEKQAKNYLEHLKTNRNTNKILPDKSINPRSKKYRDPPQNPSVHGTKLHTIQIPAVDQSLKSLKEGISNQNLKAIENFSSVCFDLEHGKFENQRNSSLNDEKFIERKRRQLFGYVSRLIRIVYCTSNEIHEMEAKLKELQEHGAVSTKVLNKLFGKIAWLNKVLNEMKLYNSWMWMNKDGFLNVYKKLLDFFRTLNYVCISKEIISDDNFSEKINHYSSVFDNFLLKANKKSNERIENIDKRIADQKFEPVKKNERVPHNRIKINKSKPRNGSRKFTNIKTKTKQSRIGPVECTGNKALNSKPANNEKSEKENPANCFPSREPGLLINTFFKPVINGLQVLSQQLNGINDSCNRKICKNTVNEENFTKILDNPVVVNQKPAKKSKNHQLDEHFSNRLSITDICSRLDKIQAFEDDIRQKWGEAHYLNQLKRHKQFKSSENSIIDESIKAINTKLIVVNKDSNLSGCDSTRKESFNENMANKRILNLNSEELESIMKSRDEILKKPNYQIKNRYTKLESIENFNKISDSITDDVIGDVAEEISQLPLTVIQNMFNTEFKM